MTRKRIRQGEAQRDPRRAPHIRARLRYRPTQARYNPRESPAMTHPTRAVRGCRRRGCASRVDREPEMFKLVDLGAGGVADPDDDVGKFCRRQIDHAFPAPLDHAKTVVGVRDHAADKGGRELHDGLPTHRHDVRSAVAGARNQYNRARLQIASDLPSREIDLLCCCGHLEPPQEKRRRIGYGSSRAPSSARRKFGFQATSQRWPSGSAK